MTRDVNSLGAGDRFPWKDYLGPEERLLWEGTPVPGLHPSPGKILVSLFGLPFMAVGIFTIVASLEKFAEGVQFWDIVGLAIFGLGFFAAGFAVSIGQWIESLLAPSRTRYALSDRRAYIATRYWPQKIETHSIKASHSVELVCRRRADTVVFKFKHEVDGDGGTKTTKIGFDDIADGDHVYKLIRKIQRAQP